MKIIFDVRQLYYLPQYLPVYEKLIAGNIHCYFLFYTAEDKTLDLISKQVIKQLNLPVQWMDNWLDALKHYQNEKAEWIIFGNTIDNNEELHKISKTAMMQHGIGPKRCYYDVSNNFASVRFVEGNHRLNRLKALYPSGNFVDTGYAKLDPLFNKTSLNEAPININKKQQLNNQTISLTELGLCNEKPTLLYAPTFYPSSIECFSKSFPDDFSNYNIIIKPHFFSLTKPRYKKQKKLLEHWGTFNNVYLAPLIDYNLVPFMNISDIMISDASSAIFEFAALDKPIAWCDFYKLRWGYRGLLSFRFKKRLDTDITFFESMTNRVNQYSELIKQIDLINSNKSALSSHRKEITIKLAGKTDGHCSERIIKYLKENQ